MKRSRNAGVDTPDDESIHVDDDGSEDLDEDEDDDDEMDMMDDGELQDNRSAPILPPVIATAPSTGGSHKRGANSINYNTSNNNQKKGLQICPTSGVQKRDCDCEVCSGSNNNSSNSSHNAPAPVVGKGGVIIPPGMILGSDGKLRKDRDAHPFGRGAVILCKYKPPGAKGYEKGDARLADVIERREVEIDEDEEGEDAAWEIMGDGSRRHRT